jgi:hypothetical protein
MGADLRLLVERVMHPLWTEQTPHHICTDTPSGSPSEAWHGASTLRQAVEWLKFTRLNERYEPDAAKMGATELSVQ